MHVIGDDFPDFGSGKIRLASSEVKFGELHFGARIGVAVGYLLPQV